MRAAGIFLLLSLSPIATAWNGGSGIEILEAVYGVRNRFCDATQAVRQRCGGTRECEVASGNHLCGDPYRGRKKLLTIRYACPEGEYTQEIRERNAAVLRCQPRRSSRSEAHRRRGSGLFIESASYGRGWRSCNATAALNDLCKGSTSCSFHVGNALCGDPHKGKRKHLEIIYSCGSAHYRADFGEREQGILDCR